MFVFCISPWSIPVSHSDSLPKSPSEFNSTGISAFTLLFKPTWIYLPGSAYLDPPTWIHLHHVLNQSPDVWGWDGA
jgi:hypothetical protein